MNRNLIEHHTNLPSTMSKKVSRKVATAVAINIDCIMQAMEAFVITQGSNILHVKIAHFDTNTLHVYLCCIDIF